MTLVVFCGKSHDCEVLFLHVQGGEWWGGHEPSFAPALGCYQPTDQLRFSVYCRSSEIRPCLWQGFIFWGSSQPKPFHDSMILYLGLFASSVTTGDTLGLLLFSTTSNEGMSH